MKKTLSIVAVSLIVLSTFSMLVPQILAEHDITSASIQPLGIESSEPPETQWNRTYGGTNDDFARCVIQTSDGGYAITGWTESFGAGGHDFWLVKTFSNGTEHWNQTYHNDNIDRANAIIETNDGGYAMAGLTGPSGLGRDAWLVKTNLTGHIQWNRTYGGAGSCNDEALSLVQTNDGGYALAGLTYCFDVGWIDAWLVKTNSTGHTRWNQTYGGPNDDGAYSVVETNDGGYTIAGYTSSFGAGDYDAWLIKTNSTGNEEWNRTYGRTSDEVAYCMIQTGDGGYAMAGATGAFGERDFLLVKTDSAGNMQWNMTYGGTSDEAAYSLVQTQDGGYAMAGWTESFGAGSQRDIWLIKLAPLVERVLLGTGWGWMRINANESVCGRAELYKIGDTQIELAIITCEGETYSRTWNIIIHKEYKFGERYVCYSSEWGFLIVRLHRHRRCQFWYAVGRGVAAFGFPNLGTLKLTPTPG